MPGDCGSLVVNATTGDIYGHIVSGDPSSGLAFIIPAYKIFDDIEKKFGTRPSFPSPSIYRYGITHKQEVKLKSEVEDRQIMQEAAVRERMRRNQNERDRLDRQRRAGIPFRSRHETELHHRPHVSFEERATQVIDDAIRAENRRRFEGRSSAPSTRGWSRRRNIDGRLQRRDTIAVTLRHVYEDDRRRGGRRFI